METINTSFQPAPVRGSLGVHGRALAAVAVVKPAVPQDGDALAAAGNDWVGSRDGSITLIRKRTPDEVLAADARLAAAGYAEAAVQQDEDLTQVIGSVCVGHADGSVTVFTTRTPVGIIQS